MGHIMGMVGIYLIVLCGDFDAGSYIPITGISCLVCRRTHFVTLDDVDCSCASVSGMIWMDLVHPCLLPVALTKELMWAHVVPLCV